MKQIQITIPENVFSVLKAEADKMGITPNILARIKLAEQLLGFQLNVSEKAYMVRFPNWKEVEAYIKIKSPHVNVEGLAVQAVVALMKRNGLTPAQKAEAERLLKN